MIESRLDRIEEMLASLISMVGINNSNFQSLENRITELEKENRSNFQSLEKRFTTLENRFDTLGKRFTAMENRFDVLENRFESLEKRFTAMENENSRRFGEVDKKLDVLLAEQDLIWDKASKNEREIGRMKKQLGL
ncbi:MAG: hypothetical protein Q8906_14690 [Bacillota bacterium]|nr:hypothetical protein [Bacillota bacterium]